MVEDRDIECGDEFEEGNTGRRTIEFFASLPDPHQSAVRFAGDGTVRVLLVAPESERIKMLPLVLLTSRLLRVRVDYVPDTSEEEPTLPDGEDESVEQPTGESPWNLQVLAEVGKQMQHKQRKPRKR